MRRIRIKNFILDERNRRPILVIESIAPRRALPLPVDIMDVPRILSALYRVREDSTDLPHAFFRLFRQLRLPRIRRILLLRDRRDGFRCELHYTLLFGLGRRHIPLNLTEGVILHLIGRVPFYADASVFRTPNRKGTDDTPLHGIYPRDLLERWKPEPKNTPVH